MEPPGPFSAAGASFLGRLLVPALGNDFPQSLPVLVGQIDGPGVVGGLRVHVEQRLLGIREHQSPLSVVKEDLDAVDE